MLGQTVKLSRLIIFYSSVISLPTHQFFQKESQKPVLFAVFSLLEQFFSFSTVVSVAKANVLQSPTIAGFARNWGPFLESPGNFSGPKSNIQTEI